MEANANQMESRCGMSLRKSGSDVSPGDKFERWTVLGWQFRLGQNSAKSSRFWGVVCRCDCGVVQVVRVCGLRSGETRSCGCLRRDLNSGLRENVVTYMPTAEEITEACLKIQETWSEFERVQRRHAIPDLEGDLRVPAELRGDDEPTEDDDATPIFPAETRSLDTNESVTADTSNVSSMNY